jgi:DNA (cytosine-5)-methyltransferase 1
MDEGAGACRQGAETMTKSSTAAHVYTLIDLFAGCGGGSLGFRQAGFAPVAAVEIDRDASAAYEANLRVNPIAKNIRLVSGSELLMMSGLQTGECTLLSGCPPCQSFTELRKGSSSTRRDRRRNRLYEDYIRLVSDVRPRHIAFENVPGMLSSRWRYHFDALLQGLGNLGYESIWDVVDAADYGIPQRRKRVLVVASRVTEPLFPEPTHFDEPTDRRRRRHRTVWQTIGDCLPLESGEYDPDDEYHEARLHSDLALKRLRAIPEGGARGDLPKRLQLECHKDHNGHHDIYGRMWRDKPAPTLTSGCTNITRGRFAHPEQDRAITLREAMLLQTFPRRTVLVGTSEQMALQIGNAIPPLLARRIGDVVMTMENVSTGTATQATVELNGRVPSRSSASRSLARSST